MFKEGTHFSLCIVSIGGGLEVDKLQFQFRYPLLVGQVL